MGKIIDNQNFQKEVNAKWNVQNATTLLKVRKSL